MSDIFSTAVVTGASRGFGRAIAAALVDAGADVVGIARGEADLAATRRDLGGRFVPMVADATDDTLAREVVHARRPGVLVLNAGAVPHMAPVQEQTWETFSRAWEVDTRHVLAWTRAALLEPLAPGSVVVSISSGAALHGSPLSGGYAGANAAIRHVRAYAAEESDRAALGIRFVTLLPQMTPTAGVGAAGVAGYAARRGVDPDTLVAEMGTVLSPGAVGAAVVDLVKNPGAAPERAITGAGLRPVA
jgi:NADP-dependent 3-hydroxy acid dehydrogenase YdfG